MSLVKLKSTLGSVSIEPENTAGGGVLTLPNTTSRIIVQEDLISTPQDFVEYGATVTLAAMQEFLDDGIENSKAMFIPAGKYEFDGDLYLRHKIYFGMDSEEGFVLTGEGSSKDTGTHLHFNSGSFIIQAGHGQLSRFHVSSDDSDGIVLESVGDTSFPTRNAFYDIRAERCAENGIKLQDTWIIEFYSCMFRFNAKFGMWTGTSTTQVITSPAGANALTVVGGEVQGNGTDGTVGVNGGVYLSDQYSTLFSGVTIEGNQGDGVYLAHVINAVFDNCHMEKNGYKTAVSPVVDFPYESSNFGFNFAVESDTTLVSKCVEIRNCNFINPTDTNIQSFININDTRSCVIKSCSFSTSISTIDPADAGVLITDGMVSVNDSTAFTRVTTGYVEDCVIVPSAWADLRIVNNATSFGKPTLVPFIIDPNYHEHVEYETDGYTFLTLVERLTYVPASTTTMFEDVVWVPVHGTEDGREITVQMNIRVSSTTGGATVLRAMFNTASGALYLTDDFLLDGATQPGGDLTGAYFIDEHSAKTLNAGGTGVSIDIGRAGAEVTDTYPGFVYFKGGTATYFKGWN